LISDSAEIQHDDWHGPNVRFRRTFAKVSFPYLDGLLRLPQSKAGNDQDIHGNCIGLIVRDPYLDGFFRFAYGFFKQPGPCQGDSEVGMGPGLPG